MMANAIDLSKKSFVLVTGASRGIGQMISVRLAANLASGSVCVLVARNGDGLSATKQQIAESNAGVVVKTYPIDLSNPSEGDLQNMFSDSLSGQLVSDFELALVIHNVGTIGDIGKNAKEFGDIAVWRSFFDTNVFSVATLNSQFVRQFEGVRTVVVNVTSKCSSVPYESFTLYCTSRAAREMYFKVLAAESKSLVVLNYSPGVVDTDMTVDVQTNSLNPDLRERFKSMRDTNVMIKPIETADKLIKVLAEGTFESGAYVDYYSV